MEKIIRYNNGIRAVIESLSAHSVSIGIFTNAGASKENAENNGISHFLEHMIFKGTKKYDAYQIAKKFEDMGASINAFTGKDCTCYYVKTVTEFTENCFDLLSHIYLESEFPDHEIQRERNVVIEEINMTADEPEYVCFDLLADSLFDGPLSQTILGPSENINRFGKSDLTKYMNEHYCGENIVVSFAGEITTQEADRLMKKYFLPKFTNDGKCSGREQNGYASKQTIKIDDYEQSNLCIGFPSVEFDSKFAHTQSLLSTILGGGMSSRLFQQIREKMGLAYSVYSTASYYVNAGAFTICCNYTANNTQKVMEAIKNEVDLLLKEGINREEFLRAKAQVKSSLVFMQENIQSQMMAFGKLLLLGDRIFDMKERLREIDSIKIEDINAFSNQLFARTPAIAYLGKAPDKNPSWN